MKASDLFVQQLETEGVEYIFGIPGEENLDLLDSLSRSKIRLIVTRHEQAAGFMAATYGRLTGKAGVCLSTLGPGATNLVTAAAFANLGAMPLVMITGQKPIKASKQGQFQLLNVVDMMLPVTRFTRQVESGDRVPSCIREAFRLAQQERPGATHLELPEDIADEQTDAVCIEPSFTRRPIAESKGIRRAAETIKSARSPLLLIGAAANRKLTCRMLRRFVEQTNIPFVTTQMGKGVINDDDARCLGTAALSSDDFVHRAFDAADVIINVGHDVVEKPPFLMKPSGRTVIHVNFTPAQTDSVYFPQLEVVGDIANSVWQLCEALGKECHWDFAFFDKVRAALAEHIAACADDDRFPMAMPRLVADVRRVLPRDGIVALDNGMYKIWFARNFPAYSPNTMLLDNALASMGAGLPSAMAARLVHPDRHIMAICGDGGFMMNSAELETAVRHKMNLVVVVLRDNAYGMIRWKQESMGLPNFGLSFGNPDFVKYAESYGAIGHRVTTSDGFAQIAEQAFDAGGVHLIEVPIDYSDNVQVLLHEAKELSAAL